MKRPVFLLLLALASASGCTGEFSSSLLGNPNSPCAPPQGTQTVLAYPANGSTGIPDNLGEIIFASSSLLPGNYHALLIDETSGETLTKDFLGVSDIVQGPLPQPATTPPFSNPDYQASANSGITFPQGHLISVHLQQVKCNVSESYGSFTVR